MEEYVIHISRYNPETDPRPVLKEYRLPRTEEKTVLEALLAIYEEVDSTLLFQFGCRYELCGKCTVKVNGRPALACKTPLEEVTILEPLDGFPIIRDLAVDRRGVLDGLRKQELVLSPGAGSETAVQPLEYFRLLRCNECGSCLSVCPMFLQGQAEGGPLFHVRSAELQRDVRDGKDRSKQMQSAFLCTTCQACTAFCHAKIGMEEVVQGLRKEVFKAGLAPESFLTVKKRILEQGNIYGLGARDRTQPVPPAMRELPKEADLLLFTGCVPAYLDMHMVPDLGTVLDLTGTSFTSLGSGEVCCGFPLYLMGDEEFEPYARKVMAQIRATGAGRLLTPCAGCYKAFKGLYGSLGDMDMEVLHTLHYLDQAIREGKLPFRREIRKRVTYHDPCDLGRGYGIFEEPRRILKAIPGVEVVEMARNRSTSRCCGGGGGLQVHEPELAVEISATRVRDALDVGAEIIVSGCAACKDNLRKGARTIPRNERGDLKVMDITEILVQAAKS